MTTQKKALGELNPNMAFKNVLGHIQGHVSSQNPYEKAIKWPRKAVKLQVNQRNMFAMFAVLPR